MRVLPLLLLLAATACAEAQPATRQVATRSAERDRVSLEVPGTGQSLTARFCRPQASGPVPLVVINHGSPTSADIRPGMRPAQCESEAVRWFLDRGYAVLLPMRRGYGASGGRWAENYGGCANPNYAAGGRESARDIAAAVAFGRAQPGIRPDEVVVVGQSAGGWGSLALAADPPPGVVAVVNMAGGRGGWAGGHANQICGGDGALISAVGTYGRTARLPTLWLYTANDSFFSPDVAAAMHRAFTGAGGRARLEALPAFGRDGHSLFFGQGGSAVWGPVVEPFLRAPS